MESGWEEKKIQALFSELRGTDEQGTPHFAAVWSHVQVDPRRSRALRPAFVAAIVVLIFALVSLALWSRRSTRTEPSVVVNTAPPSIVNAPPAPVTWNTGTGSDHVEPAHRPIKRLRPMRSRAQRNALVAAHRKLEREAKAITNWESPTSALLTSPSDEIFSSLPELNKSAGELRAFLPSRPN